MAELNISLAPSFMSLAVSLRNARRVKLPSIRQVKQFTLLTNVFWDRAKPKATTLSLRLTPRVSGLETKALK
jgi:hypothetical protein